MKFKKILSSLSIILALSAFTTISFPDDSEARRMGGRRSIGRSIAPKATPPAGARVTQQRQGMNQNQAVGGAAAMNRTGMFGGMLGGLLAGSLLGSLFMGGGLGGGGGFLDIIIIGLLGFFAYRFFMSRSGNKNSRNGTQRHDEYQQPTGNESNQGSNNAWDRFRNEPKEQSSQYEAQDANINIPADFDEEQFLKGAKPLYLRMQEAWDQRDLDDILQFTSPALFAELAQQANEDPTPSKTEILLVEATVIGVQRVDGEEQVAVLFDVLMREDQTSEATEQVKEIWNFSKEINQSGSWKLDGIQQV